MPWIAALLVVAAPASTPVSGGHLHLERGLALLAQEEFAEARAELERALDGGPYAHTQVVDLYRGLGLARAFTDDEAAALWAFERLLAVAPDESLPYTTSPRATFVFDRARQAARAQRPAEILVVTDPVLTFDRPLRCSLERRGDPLGAMATVTLLYRLQGQPAYQRLEAALPPAGQRLELGLPAIPLAAAHVDAQGEPGATLELALLARDVRGWEIYRGPPPERPLQVPVAASASRAWYTEWWLWGLVGGSAAALATAAVVTALLWPPPEQIPARYEVLR